MSLKIKEIINSAEGTIDQELLTKEGRGGFISTGYLHNKPLIEYLKSDESLEYLFDNIKNGVTITRDDEERTATPDSAYRTLFAVTSQRVFCVVGREDGDKVLEIPMEEITGAVVDTGFRKDLLTIHSTLGRTEFYTRSDSDTASAVEYIRRQCRETETEQPDAGDDTPTGDTGSGDSLSKRQKMTSTIEWVAAELGRIPQYSDMHDYGSFEPEEYAKRFSSWQDAIESTDLDIEARLIDNLQGVATAVGRTPTQSDIKEYGTYNVNLYAEYFGGYNQALSAADVQNFSTYAVEDTTERTSTGSDDEVDTDQSTNKEAESVESKTPGPDTDETDVTSTDATTPSEQGHQSESGESSAGTDTSQERRQDIQAGGEGTSIGVRSESEAESSSVETTTGSPAYVDTEAVSDYTFDAVAEAESKVSRADTLGKHADETRQLLIRAHNSLCQVLADDQPGIDRDDLERRIAELEHRLDDFGTTARPEDVAPDDTTDSGADNQGRTTAGDGAAADVEQSQHNGADPISRRPNESRREYLVRRGGKLSKSSKPSSARADTEDGTTDSTEDISTDEVSVESPLRREKMIRTIEEVAADLGRIPKYVDMHHHGSFEAKEYSKEFTSWQEAIKATDIDIEAPLIDELQSVGEEVGRAPTRSELEEQGSYDSNRYVEHFGSYDQALSAADLEKPSRDTLLAELQRVADRLGCTPTSAHVKEFGDYPVTYYRKQLGSVRNAAEEAGMDYESNLIDAIKALAIGLGHRPTTGEFNEYALYSHSYTYNFFDGWREACEAAGVGSDDAVEGLLSDLIRTEINEIIENAPVTDTFREEYTEEPDSTDQPGSTEEDTARNEEKVIADTIRAIAIGLGQQPNRLRFTQFSEHSISDVGRHFENWTDACQAAGVNSDDVVRELHTALSQSEVEELLENAALNDKFYDAHPDIGSTEGDDEQVSDDQLDGRKRETLLEELESVIADLGRLPTYSEMYDYEEVDPRDYSEEFGGWDNALQATDLDVEARLLSALQDVGAELGRAPTKAEVDEHGTYDRGWYDKYFDSWESAVTQTGFTYPTEEELLEEIRKITDELGYVPAKQHIENYDTNPAGFYRREFGSVKQATAAAGLDYRDDVIESIRRLAVEINKTPTTTDFNEHAPYSSSYVYDHFDTWGDACAAAGVDSADEVKKLIKGSRTQIEESDPGQSFSDKLKPSPLAEYYEAFGNLVAVQEALFYEELENLNQSGPMLRWHELVHNRWAGDSSAKFTQSYGAQQNERVGFNIGEYRDAYGDGNRVTDFQAIETTALPEAIVKLVSSVSETEQPRAAELRIPETPEGGEPVPVLVESTDAFERAESLINEFPEQPKTGMGQQDSTTRVNDEQDSLESSDDSKADPQAEDDAPERTGDELTDIGGVTASTAEALRSAGYHTTEELKAADKDELAEIEKVGSQTASRIKLLLGS